MKKSKKYNKKTFLLPLILALIMIACGGGDGGTSVNPQPEPEPNPEPTISFDSGNLTPGASFSYTFNNTGSTDYVCIYHVSQGMKGSITVEDGASTDDVTVTMTEYSFSPADITIGPGTVVTWVNKGNMNHTATSQ